ncbi:hypothetical protein OF83DRAFT_730694 [Amylostereum chailletii]|nr:hypothetical protein OF83DRAFT_730694 [Amylostereum chailletii]
MMGTVGWRRMPTTGRGRGVGVSIHRRRVDGDGATERARGGVEALDVWRACVAMIYLEFMGGLVSRRAALLQGLGCTCRVSFLSLQVRLNMPRAGRASSRSSRGVGPSNDYLDRYNEVEGEGEGIASIANRHYLIPTCSVSGFGFVLLVPSGCFVLFCSVERVREGGEGGYASIYIYTGTCRVRVVGKERTFGDGFEEPARNGNGNGALLCLLVCGMGVCARGIAVGGTHVRL